MGTDMFRDFFAGIRDIVSGGSRLLRGVAQGQARVAPEDMIEEVVDLGADAVIGIDRDDAHIRIGKRSMLMVSAYGTTDKLELTRKFEAKVIPDHPGQAAVQAGVAAARIALQLDQRRSGRWSYMSVLGCFVATTVGECRRCDPLRYDLEDGDVVEDAQIEPGRVVERLRRLVAGRQVDVRL